MMVLVYNADRRDVVGWLWCSFSSSVSERIVVVINASDRRERRCVYYFGSYCNQPIIRSHCILRSLFEIFNRTNNHVDSTAFCYCNCEFDRREDELRLYLYSIRLVKSFPTVVISYFGQNLIFWLKLLLRPWFAGRRPLSSPVFHRFFWQELLQWGQIVSTSIELALSFS